MINEIFILTEIISLNFVIEFQHSILGLSRRIVDIRIVYIQLNCESRFEIFEVQIKEFVNTRLSWNKVLKTQVEFHVHTTIHRS